MQKVATPDTLAGAPSLSRKRFPLGIALTVSFLAALWFVLCRELSGEWSVNEQYNFGWFVPFFALYFFYLRWQDRPSIAALSEPRNTREERTAVIDRRYRTERAAAVALAITALLLLLPIRLFEIANPEWRLLAWVHALAVVVLTLLVLWWAGGKAWLRHFAFPVAFILIAVPWPTAVETPVIQGLMRVVARVAAESAMLLGTPAQVEGNLIRVTNGLVGVNEACSGIRSLQTSIMIGLLFGEVKRLSTLRRVTLVVSAVIIALLANFIRAFFLVQVAATENLSEVGHWHDVAGYSIIALVFLITMAFAYLVGKSEIRQRTSEIQGERSQLAIGNWKLAITAAFCWLLFIEIGSAAWYRLHERNLVSSIHWGVHWPENAPNFRKLKIDDEIRAVLRFDEGRGGAFTVATLPRSAAAATSGENTISCLLYVFRWNPGKNSALLANLHRPDVCLPASGWKQLADHGVRTYPISNSIEIPFRHFEFQRAFDGSTPQIAHAFYCLSEDRVDEASTSLASTNSPGMFGNRSEWTRAERLGAVLEGRRHLGQQVIEAILMSNEPLSAADAESRLRDLVRDVIVLRPPENSL